MPKQNHTPGSVIAAQYALPLLEDVHALGGDLDVLWQQAGLQSPLRDALAGRTPTLPAAGFTRLYRSCLGELEQRVCQREGKRPLGKPAVNLLCHATLPCRDLAEVIERVQEFNSVMEERGGTITLRQERGVAIFAMDPRRRHRDSASMLVDATGLYFYFQLFSWLLGQRLPLLNVCLSYPAPGRHYPTMDLFGRTPAYGAPANELWFSAGFLRYPTGRTLPELERIIDYFPFDLTLGEGIGEVSETRVRLLILDALQHRHEVPALETTAQLFHISPATLRRRLQAQGTAYSDIRGACQREVAEQLLASSELTLTDIAEHLGFGSDRAFRRAFQQWSGQTPSAFRETVAR